MLLSTNDLKIQAEIFYDRFMLLDRTDYVSFLLNILLEGNF